MPFKRLSLDELAKNIQSDFSQEFNDGNPLPEATNLYKLSYVIAGATHLIHGHLDWISEQIFPDTAEPENFEKWAKIWGIRENTRQAAKGYIKLKGKAGSKIPSETRLVRSDQVIFKTLRATTLSDRGDVLVEVRCEKLGRIGNSYMDTPLTLISSVTGVEPKAFVVNHPEAEALGLKRGLSGGTDAETPEEMLKRLLAEIQGPVQGGTKQDYVLWSKAVAGVGKVWVYPRRSGAGTVDIAFVTDNIDSPIPIQDSDVYRSLSETIERNRPSTATVNIVLPTPKLIDITLKIAPQNERLQADVTTTLKKLLYDAAEPHGKIYLSSLHKALAKIPRLEDYRIIVPTEDISLDESRIEVPVLGAVKWI